MTDCIIATSSDVVVGVGRDVAFCPQGMCTRLSEPRPRRDVSALETVSRLIRIDRDHGPGQDSREFPIQETTGAQS